MSKEYIRNTWINDQAPPLNAANLNNVEEGTIVNNRQDLAVIKNITIDANYTLTAEENQYGNIKITDTGTVLTVARNIIMNGNEHTFVFNNATAQDLTVANSGGTGITVSAGQIKHLRNDSVNVIGFEAGGGFTADGGITFISSNVIANAVPSINTGVLTIDGLATYTDSNSALSVETLTDLQVPVTGLADNTYFFAKKEGKNEFVLSPYMPSQGLYDKVSVDDNRYIIEDGKVYPEVGGELISIHSVTLNAVDTLHQTIACNIGDKIKISYDFVFNNDTGRQAYVNIGTGGSNSSDVFSGNTEQQHLSDYGTHDIEFTATATTMDITFFYNFDTSPDYCSFDNISVFKKEAAKGTALTENVSWNKNPIVVASNAVQSVDMSQEFIGNYIEDLVIEDLVIEDILKLNNLPTVDPAIQGVVWSNNNILTISTGA